MDVTSCSKFLSFVLRHKPESIGIELDSAGWVGVDELLEKSLKSGRYINEALLKKVVRENNKKRFEFSDDGTMIRASQGHSVEVDLKYEESVPENILYHGTCEKFAKIIYREGIQKMSRHHVHLSDNIETATQVGSRHGKVIILTINAKLMYDAGHKFYKSTNGVWLTEEVPKEYIL